MSASKHDWTRLSFLIIDDFPNFCSALRAMVHSYGVEEVDVVHNGDDAIRALRKNKYDVVLCDYNLGEGRNGNDILEEAKIQGLMKSASLFLMITAESAAEMVRGALEYQPDDYLTKPFTKEVLQTRLERLLERNRHFRDVYRSIDKGELGSAVEQCDGLLKEHPRYKGFILKLKSELLMKQKAYGDARNLYNEVLMIRPLAWAKLGLGKTWFYEEQYERAKTAFEELVAEDRGYVQAWDWLARCQQQLGDSEAAQAALQEAVKISPINVRRQTLLGEIALKNNDMERAEMAYNRSVKIGKHSVFRSPDNYLKLTDILVKRMEESEGLVNKRLETKALGAMDELRQLYKGDTEVTLKSRLAENSVHQVQGNAQEADKALLRAYDLCSQDEEGLLPAELKEQLIIKLEEGGRGEMVSKLVEAMQQEESSHNRQAVEYYDQGDLDRALEMLKLAVTEKPRSFAICLNTAQVAMHWMVKHHITDELMTLAGEALSRVREITPEDKRYKLYQNLSARYEKMKKQRPACNG